MQKDRSIIPDGKGGTMARYTVQIGTRSCCGKHRWPLVDIVETLATSGFEYIVLDRLPQSLGSNALCFTGNLMVTASVEADEIRAQEGLTLIKSKGLSCCLEPIRFLASTKVM